MYEKVVRKFMIAIIGSALLFGASAVAQQPAPTGLARIRSENEFWGPRRHAAAAHEPAP